MAKVIIEMNFDFDGFDGLSDEEKFESIEEVLGLGADLNNADIKITSVTIKDQ